MGLALLRGMTTEQEYANIAADIFHDSANPSPGELARARAYLESFPYTTSAVGALVLVMREQYAALREEGCAIVDGAPCADALAACIIHIANAEAREI